MIKLESSDIVIFCTQIAAFQRLHSSNNGERLKQLLHFIPWIMYHPNITRNIHLRHRQLKNLNRIRNHTSTHLMQYLYHPYHPPDLLPVDVLSLKCIFKNK